MERLSNNVVTLKLLDSMREYGSWAGETHLQKAAYILKKLHNVPLSNEFVLYKHGPFSFDLRDELAQLQAAGQIRVEPQPAPFGPKLGISPVGKNLLQRLEYRWKPYQDQIEQVAQWLSGYGVKKLEQLATALYVISELPHEDASVCQSRLQEYKPHVSDVDAQAAIAEVCAHRMELKTS
ncbi:hypothetical protein [Desulfonatronospira sp.]|uniref:hypothetical protein n=1 Tax=Desulfonatronospira sp. TaxID=1962951 RepID=UPI0025BBC233|nr:hypothetical protein [Desulfonatronospira sp.]